MNVTLRLIKRLLLIILLVGLTAFYHNLNAQGYKIKIKVTSFKDSSIFLGHYLAEGNALYPDDTIKLDKNGSGIFKGNKQLPIGMYFIYLPSKRYFDILLTNNQIFSIEADTADLLKTIKFSGSTENTIFYEYRNLIEDKSVELNRLIKKKKIASNPQEKDSLSNACEKINQEVLEYIKKIKTDYSGSFLTTILNSMEEIVVPPPPKDDKGKIIDSAFQYNYWHKHFFDNFDFTDARLLRTPFYEKPIKKYIEKVIPQIPDSIMPELDMMLGKVQNNQDLFRYMLGTFFKHYASSQLIGADGIFVHISEKWFIPYATWADKESMAKLKKEIAKMKPSLIGNIAPNIKLVEVPKEHFLIAKNDTAAKSNPYVGNNFTISDIKAKYLILVFWESDCGHCKKTMPLLYDSVYPRLKDKGVKILAVHLVGSVEGKRKWIDFVNDHQMYDWINAWSPYSYDYMDLYNVSYKPLIYILDENKKIICKRIGPEQIEPIIGLDSSSRNIKLK
jgi:thiol-disulfide isomerase/thioredoxin